MRAGGQNNVGRACAGSGHRWREGVPADSRSGVPRLARLPAQGQRAGGRYGVGHTALREPGDTRGSAAGRQGRFWPVSPRRKEVTARTRTFGRCKLLGTYRRRTSLRDACERLAPVCPGYAGLPIEEGFGREPLREEPFLRLYLVVFRSLRREGADLDLLGERDHLAQEEALGSGVLFRYFKGEANERRGCLSFCLWETRGHAERAAGGAAHSGAARISAQTYERYDLERYYLTKCGDAGGSVVFERLAG